jgi:hypothetical protein
VTRSEKDFARFFRNLLNSAALDTRWDIVSDNLDIHLRIGGPPGRAPLRHQA